MHKRETFRTLRLMADLSMEIEEENGWHRALEAGTPVRDLLLDVEELPTITLYEPWATLIAYGEKQIETRSWPMKYRGLIGIHAGMKNLVRKSSRILKGMSEEGWQPRKAFSPLCVRPGHLVGVAEVIGCVSMYRVEEPDPHGTTRMGRPSGEPDVSTPSYDYFVMGNGMYNVFLKDEREPYVGDFGEGRFAWLLTRPRRLVSPIPCGGWQRVWKKKFDGAVLTVPA